MTLRRFALPITTTARTGAGLALIALLGAGIAATNTDAVVAGRFTAALEAAPPRAKVDVAVTTGADKTLVSGSEAYWLEKRRHDEAGAALEPAAWSTPLLGNVAVGTRITFSTGQDAHEFEVVAVTEIAPSPGAATQASNGHVERRLAITCRDLSSPDRQLQTFETTISVAPGAAKTARAL
jgi:hypothetical protein